MEDKDEPPDAIDSKPMDKPRLTKKQRARRMYKDLCNDDELMHELNVLLREKKLEQLKNG